MARAAEILAGKFPFEPTQDQYRFFQLTEQFVLSTDPRCTMLLKGYAGTGKTSLVGAMVKVLPSFGFKIMLLAPTGRAAKVLAKYARKSAFTIHKIIYKLKDSESLAGGYFQLKKNYSSNTIFIVDEASMISEGHRDTGLLSDLVKYVFQKSGNKLLLIGDNAQLPPVGQANSLALSESHLEEKHGLAVLSSVLNEVMRQSLDSGILKNANSLRHEMNRPEPKIKFTLGLDGIYKMNGSRLEEGLRYAYDKYGSGETIVICRSNRNAVDYNRHIRHSLFYFEQELDAGDQIMIVRNNYFYQPEHSPMGFLANGEFAEVMKIIKFEEMYGFRFADIEIRLLDDPTNERMVVKVILDTLHSIHPSLSEEQFKSLYDQVRQDYQGHLKSSELKNALKKDPYLQSLQIKFAYALTCHKSQGGQWKAIFLDKGYVPLEQLNIEYLRWLYTGVTRATDELFLVNFGSEFFNS